MITLIRRINSTETTRIISATLIGVVLVFSKLGGDGIANYDDAFYAQKAKEIWQTGSWMTLHYAGRPAFENPPGFIWLIALSYKIFGINDFGAIFPSALFGALTMILVYFFAKSLFGEGTATLAAFVMATTFFFIKYARHAMIDVTLSFFVTLALLAAWTATRSDRRYFLLWGTAVAVCVLLKSVLGFFPALITVTYLVVSGRGKMLADPWFIGGSAIALMIGCSWYLHEYAVHGGAFVEVHFTWLIFQRGFEAGAGPWYGHLDYLKDILITYWPWLPALAVGVAALLKDARKGDDRALMLLVWISSILLVMSLMQMRSAWYIMPVYPAAAIVSGFAIERWRGERYPAPAVQSAFLAAGVLALIVVNVFPVRLSSVREADVRTLAPMVAAYGNGGARIIGYGFDYHSVNNALLFYSDYPAEPVYHHRADLFAEMRDTGTTVCVLYTREVEGLGTFPEGFSVVARTEGLSLISNGSPRLGGQAGPSD